MFISVLCAYVMTREGRLGAYSVFISERAATMAFPMYFRQSAIIDKNLHSNLYVKQNMFIFEHGMLLRQ